MLHTSSTTVPGHRVDSEDASTQSNDYFELNKIYLIINKVLTYTLENQTLNVWLSYGMVLDGKQKDSLVNRLTWFEKITHTIIHFRSVCRDFEKGFALQLSDCSIRVVNS